MARNSEYTPFVRTLAGDGRRFKYLGVFVWPRGDIVGAERVEWASLVRAALPGAGPGCTTHSLSGAKAAFREAVAVLEAKKEHLASVGFRPLPGNPWFLSCPWAGPGGDAETSRLRAETSRLRAENARLAREACELRDRVQELERKMKTEEKKDRSLLTVVPTRE